MQEILTRSRRGEGKNEEKSDQSEESLARKIVKTHTILVVRESACRLEPFWVLVPPGLNVADPLTFRARQ